MHACFSRRLLFPLAIVALLALLSRSPAAPVGAAPPDPVTDLSVTLQSHLGGQIESLAVQGDHAFVGVGYELVVMDITSSPTPIRVGDRLLPEEIHRIVTAGDFAYVMGRSGLYVVTIANPALPRLLGHFPLEGEARGLAVKAPYVYLAERGAGLHILDVTDPRQPVRAGQYAAGSQAMQVTGDYLVYLTHYLDRPVSQLHLVDLDDPVDPVEVGTVDVQGVNDHLRIRGNHAYVAGWKSIDQSFQPAFGVIDLTEPAAPEVLVEGYEVPGPPASAATALAVDGKHAYVAVNAGVHVIDVADPASPAGVGQYEAASTIASAHTEDGYLYLAQPGYGLEVVDVTAPDAPAGVAQVRNLGEVALVAAGDGVLYTLNGARDDSRSLRVVELADPARPAVIGAVEAGTPQALAVTEQRIYAAGYVTAAGGDGGNSGSLLQIFEGSTPHAPERLGSYRGAEEPRAVAIDGDYAYIAASTGLHIVDISDPANPTEAGLYNPGDGALSVAVRNDRAYLGYYSNGVRSLRIVDVTDPTDPALLATYEIDETVPGRIGPSDVALRGDHAYLAMESGGMLVLDISDPAQVAVVSHFQVGEAAPESSTVALAIVGEYAFLAEYEGGFRVLDIANPAEPVQRFQRGTLHRAVDIAADGQQIYVADERGGLLIFRYFEATSRTYLPLLTSPGRASFSSDTPK